MEEEQIRQINNQRMKKYWELNKAKRSTINKNYHARKLLNKFKEKVLPFPFGKTFRINTALFLYAKLNKENMNRNNLHAFIDAWVESGITLSQKSERSVFVKKELERLALNTNY